MGLRGVPVDTVKDDEIPEGKLVVFGLRLPRDIQIKRRGNTMINVVMEMPFDDVANYFRDRLDGGKVLTGPSNTSFRKATVIATGKHVVDVDVIRIWEGARVIVKDRSPVERPPEPDLTEEERWRRLGLTPDGKVLEEFNQ